MTEQKIDNGNETVTANAESVDTRHVANAKAAEIATAIIKSESGLAVTAKDHGAAIFATVYGEGSKVTLDTMIGESKLAAGFKTLADKGEAGRKAKQRLNVYFSNYRLVAERWDGFSADERKAMMNGETSVHYQASEIRRKEAEAKRAEAKANAEEMALADAEPLAEPTLTEQAAALLEAYKAASMDERNEAFDTLNEIFALVDADTLALQSEETEQTAQAA